MFVKVYPVQLTASSVFGSSPYTYTWFDANNNQLGTGSPFTFNPSSNVTLTAVVTDQFGCSDAETVDVTTQNCNPQVADICCPFDGWDYITPITLTNNSPIATSGNLQTLLILNTQLPISQGKMQANGNDIRFIEGVCTNVLPHYIESGINTTQTNVWVRLPSIAPNSSITIYLKYGNLTAPNVSVPYTGSANAMFPNVLTVAGTQNLSGTQNYDWINVPLGTTITTNNSQAVNLNARKIVFEGTFDGKGRGYAAQAGPGAGGSGGGSVGGGGGGYGGNGGGGGNPNGGLINGTANGFDIDFGSGGGNSDCNGSRGGGNINLNASVVAISGTIDCSGNDNNVNSCNEEGGGGGSGGGVLITSDYISGAGSINVQGGTGENSVNKEGGGGGGGGRIKFFYTQTNSFTGANQVNGAAAGSGGQSGMQPGQNGTFYAGTIPGTSIIFGIENPVSIPSVLFSSTDVCENNPSNFSDQTTLESGGSIATWQWDFGDGTGISTDQNPTYTYNGPGQYDVTLIVTSSTGCSDTLQQLVTINPGVTANFTAQNVCLGEPVVFSNQSSASVTTWSWDFDDNNSDNTENPSHTFANSGTYSVTLTATSANGCTDDFSTDITVYSIPTVNAGSDLTICSGDQITLTASGAANYSWSPSSVSNGQAFTPLTTGDYTVTGTDANGCEDTDLMTVTVLPIPNAEFSSVPTSGFPGDQFTLINLSSNATSFDWNFGNGETNSANTNVNQTIDYTSPGTYNVVLSASNGICADSLSIQIIILTPDVEIFVPNVFTVNNDGINDTWMVEVKNAKSATTQIFNRWGNEMIQLGLNEEWDGSVDGIDAKDGVYFYKYLIEDNFGNLFNGQGHFTLIRSSE